MTDVIIKFETKKGVPNLKAYDAQLENPEVIDLTIGYGFNLKRPGAEATFKKIVPEVDFDKVKTGQQNITKEQASKLFEHDMTDFVNRAKSKLGGSVYDSLPPNVKSAVLSAVYRDDLGTKTATLMKAGNWEEACLEYLRYKQYENAHKLGITGIRTRMNWNAEQFYTMIKK